MTTNTGYRPSNRGWAVPVLLLFAVLLGLITVQPAVASTDGMVVVGPPDMSGDPRVVRQSDGLAPPSPPYLNSASCHVAPDTLTTGQCATIEWGGVTFWSYEIPGNPFPYPFGLAVVRDNAIVRWRRHDGARYIWNIELDEVLTKATFWGQGNRTVTLDWSDLHHFASEYVELEAPASIFVGSSVTVRAQVTRHNMGDLDGEFRLFRASGQSPDFDNDTLLQPASVKSDGSADLIIDATHINVAGPLRLHVRYVYGNGQQEWIGTPVIEIDVKKLDQTISSSPVGELDPASDTGSADYLSWIEDARPVVDVAGDVLNRPGSILDAINRLDDLAGTPLTQNRDTGEMELHLPDFVASVLPVQVTQAPADVAPGLYITDDGDVLFVTDSGQAVLSYPVVIGKEPFRIMIDDEELTLEFDDRANLRGSHPELDFYFSVRPDLVSLPAHRHSQPGVFEHPMPGFDRELSMSFLFEENGVLLEQDLVPTSPDWFALKDALLAIEELTSVRIDMQGIIHAVLDGEPVQARLSYRVYIDVEAEAEHATIRAIGEQTGNGLPDFEVVYPNGEVQGLFPLREVGGGKSQGQGDAGLKYYQ